MSESRVVQTPVQFFENEDGNRYLLRDESIIPSVRQTAQKVLDTELYPKFSIGNLRHKFNSFVLENSVIVTMGDYDDDEVTHIPASGSSLARLVLANTDSLPESSK